MRSEISELDTAIETLETKIEEKNAELGALEALYGQKQKEINVLQKELGLKTTQNNYKAARGDLVDEMIAQYMNMGDCPLPIRRLGDGFYMFGSKKIYAKIINGKLVIRVGGGYMIIDKFIETYAQSEIDKLQRIAVKQGLTRWQELDFMQFGP